MNPQAPKSMLTESRFHVDLKPADSSALAARKERFSTLTKTRAASAKQHLELYYNSWKKSLKNIFEFTSVSGSVSRALEVNFTTANITQYDSKRKAKRAVWNFSDIFQVLRAPDPASAVIRKKDDNHVTIKFKDTWERENFYELCFLGINGSLPPSSMSGVDSQQDQEEQISIFVGTWNMGGKHPTPGESWIPFSDYDLFCIVGEECNDALFSEIFRTLPEDIVQIEISSIMLVQMAIFVKRKHLHKISYIQRHTEVTGIAGQIGNKGTVGISLLFHETSLCFLGSHFAPHQEAVSQRNDNYTYAISKFPLGFLEDVDILNQFDHVFWSGDFNYRIDLPRVEVCHHISKNELNYLFTKDQLNVQRQKGNVFECFEEGDIFFKPTYKRVFGSCEYDNGEKQRIPSWCDRVLWKTLPATDPLLLVSYSSCESVTSSDHVPVYALFEGKIRKPPKPLGNPYSILLDLHTRDIRAPNLELPRLFISFSAPFLSNKISYRTDFATGTNTSWDSSQVSQMITSISDPEYLNTCNLSAVLNHVDHNNRIIEIGQFPVPLFGSLGSGSAFDCVVLRNGHQFGSVSGKVKIVPSEKSMILPPLITLLKTKKKQANLLSPLK
eukprot:TRINITY_DN3427_c0_g1_i1.p1 TRINITY_DN3427_c0_g1~~TRINITY_DN3427_c0_g1_i1.p1  ORF type:complete len:612 (+),score=100.12 TRINITY_DN3427_c0_g1_i1:7-1842(+)